MPRKKPTKQKITIEGVKTQLPPTHKGMRATEGQIAEALRAAGGFITHAAKQLGMAHSSIVERVQRSPYLQQVRAEMDEKYLDLAETMLIRKINEADLGAICFYLKCKGKHRGYVEKQIIEQTIEHSIKKLDDKELDMEIKKLESDT